MYMYKFTNFSEMFITFKNIVIIPQTGEKKIVFCFVTTTYWHGAEKNLMYISRKLFNVDICYYQNDLQFYGAKATCTGFFTKFACILSEIKFDVHQYEKYIHIHTFI